MAKDKAAVPAAAKKITVTYKGINDSVDYLGVTMKKGEPVEVTEANARIVKGNAFFDVQGLPDDPETFATADEALEAERAKHDDEMAELTRLHSEAMQAQADSLKAGWKQQHDAMQKRIDELEAELAGPAI